MFTKSRRILWGGMFILVTALLLLTSQAALADSLVREQPAPASDPALSVSPSNWHFGSWLVGTTASAQTFTLTNTGTSNLNLGALTLTGDFAALNDLCSGQLLGASETCTFAVTFSPTAQGLRTGAVSIPSDSPSSPDSVALSGTGLVEFAYCGSTADSTSEFIQQVQLGTGNQSSAGSNYHDYTDYNFTDLRQGSANPMYVTAFMKGEEFIKVWVDFNHDSDFADADEEVDFGGFIFDGSAAIFKDLTVPNTALLGPTRMRVSIRSNMAPLPCAVGGYGETEDYTVTITPPVPVVSVTPVSWNFGEEDTGSTSVAKSFALVNTGSAALALGELSISGDFAFSSNTCDNVTLLASESCAFAVTFSPTAGGLRSGEVSIPSNAAISPAIVTLSGTGVQLVAYCASSANSLAEYIQQVQLGNGSQDSLGDGYHDYSATSFTDLLRGASVPLHVTGFTRGSYPEYIKVWLDFNHDFDFSDPGETLDMGSFTFAGNKVFSSNLVIPHDALPGPTRMRVSLRFFYSGDAAPTPCSTIGLGETEDYTVTIQVDILPALSFSPATWDFGDLEVGSSSAAKSFIITNSGTADLVTGTLSDSGDFSISNNTCDNRTLAPAAACTFDVTFSPVAIGVQNGEVSIPSNTDSSPNRLALRGAGVVFIPAVSVSPASWDFGTQNVGSTSAANLFTLTNTGLADLVVGAPTISGDFVLASDLCNGQTIAPAATCAFEVTFSPISVGSKTGAVSIPSNADSSPNRVTLGGVGIAAPAVTTNDATDITTMSATLNGTVNANNSDTTVIFEYGLTAAYGSSIHASPNLVVGMTNTPVSATITGLMPNTIYRFRLKAISDGGTTPSGGLILTTLNPPPTDIQLSAKTVLENKPAGAVVGNLSATDPDPSEVFTFSLGVSVGCAGNHNAAFQVVGAQLKTKAVFDFETQNRYIVCLRVTDSLGATFDKSFVVTVTNVMEEIVKNGGFEFYPSISKIPTNWAKSSTFGVLDGKHIGFKTGKYAVKIANTVTKFKSLSQSFTVSTGAPGQNFIFSYWVKGTTQPVTGICQGQVLFYSGSVLKWTKTLPCGKTGTFGYTLKTSTFTSQTVYSKVVIKFTYSKANSAVWFDVVSLKK